MAADEDEEVCDVPEITLSYGVQLAAEIFRSEACLVDRYSTCRHAIPKAQKELVDIFARCLTGAARGVVFHKTEELEATVGHLGYCAVEIWSLV